MSIDQAEPLTIADPWGLIKGGVGQAASLRETSPRTLLMAKTSRPC